MKTLKLPLREEKNRTFGLTSVADFGIPLGELRMILEDYHEYIDIAKLAVGSGYITPNLKEKIQLYKTYNIQPYCGGTLFEKFYVQNKLEDYRVFLHEMGIDIVEVSTGVIVIPLEKRVQIVKDFKENFSVISEVGSKDPNLEMPVSEWKEEISALLNAGCQYVITEGRDSGTSGIYSKSGVLKEDLIHELTKDLDYKNLIFEAPNAKSQMYFINQLGANVNLGNVKIREVLLLEAQRRGLRAETFKNEV